MNIIVFSKDRAMQLDLLLRSMPEKNNDISVLFTGSDYPFLNGYEELYDEFFNVWMWRENNFKENLIDMIDPDEFATVFFTDDDVVINDFDFGEAEEVLRLYHDVSCVSLRLNPYLGYCYTMNREQRIPLMYRNNHVASIEDELYYNWREADADFGYPMSLDGHIFRTEDILPLLKRLRYKNPNQLEMQLAANPINRPLMMCYDESKIMNIAANRVQETCKNRHGNITAKELNDKWLDGWQIDLEPLKGYKNNACHVEYEYKYIRR